MCKKVGAEFGALDIFVNNALFDMGSVMQAPMDVTLDKWDIVLNSQARAFLLGCQESGRLMSDGGRIIAIGYNPGTVTGSWQPYVAMGAAKAALEAVCRYFAVALAKRGITVNVISPGFTEDTFLSTLPEKTQNAIRSWHENGWTPMGRLARPEDIANAVALLCSEDAAWITGQVITVDGGASLMNSDFPLEVQRG
jgi:enoyl-[acyl-carrier protein] reductase III